MNFSAFFIDKLSQTDRSSSAGSKKNTHASYMFSDIIKICEEESAISSAGIHSDSELLSDEAFPALGNVVQVTPQEFNALSKFILDFVQDTIHQINLTESTLKYTPALINKKQFVLSQERLQNFLGGFVEQIEVNKELFFINGSQKLFGGLTNGAVDLKENVVASIVDHLKQNNSLNLTVSATPDRLNLNISLISEKDEKQAAGVNNEFTPHQLLKKIQNKENVLAKSDNGQDEIVVKLNVDFSSTEEIAAANKSAYANNSEEKENSKYKTEVTEITLQILKQEQDNYDFIPPSITSFEIEEQNSDLDYKVQQINESDDFPQVLEPVIKETLTGLKFFATDVNYKENVESSKTQENKVEKNIAPQDKAEPAANVSETKSISQEINSQQNKSTLEFIKFAPIKEPVQKAENETELSQKSAEKEKSDIQFQPKENDFTFIKVGKPFTEKSIKITPAEKEVLQQLKLQPQSASETENVDYEKISGELKTDFRSTINHPAAEKEIKMQPLNETFDKTSILGKEQLSGAASAQKQASNQEPFLREVQYNIMKDEKVKNVKPVSDAKIFEEAPNITKAAANETQNKNQGEKEFAKYKTPENIKNSFGQSINVSNEVEIEKIKSFSDVKILHETVKTIKSAEIIPEAAKFIQQGEKQSITFQLTPENLGKVKLIVDLIENRLNTRIEVENEQIKQFIQSNIEQLKQALHSSGINLSNVTVSLAGNEQKFNKEFASKKKSSEKSEKIKFEEEQPHKKQKLMGYNTYEFLA